MRIIIATIVRTIVRRWPSYRPIYWWADLVSTLQGVKDPEQRRRRRLDAVENALRQASR